MRNLNYGFRFIGACFSLIKENPRLLLPWLYLIAGNLVLLIMWFMPLALAAVWLISSPVGFALLGVISVIGTASIIAWGEVPALYTCQIAFTAPEESVISEEKTSRSQRTINLWKNGLLLALARPGWAVIFWLYQLFNPKNHRRLAWLDARCLLHPVISLEGKSLNQAVDRVDQILSDNLLRFRPNLVKVDWIADFIHGFLVIIGLTAGFLIGFMVANPFTAGSLRRILGAAIGSCVAVLLITLGGIFSSFTRACYATTVYQWVRNIETVRQTDQAEKALTPAILKKVLEKHPSVKREP